MAAVLVSIANTGITRNTSNTANTGTTANTGITLNTWELGWPIPQPSLGGLRIV